MSRTMEIVRRKISTTTKTASDVNPPSRKADDSKFVAMVLHNSSNRDAVQIQLYTTVQLWE